MLPSEFAQNPPDLVLYGERKGRADVAWAPGKSHGRVMACASLSSPDSNRDATCSVHLCAWDVGCCGRAWNILLEAARNCSRCIPQVMTRDEEAVRA